MKRKKNTAHMSLWMIEYQLSDGMMKETCRKKKKKIGIHTRDESQER